MTGDISKLTTAQIIDRGLEAVTNLRNAARELAANQNQPHFYLRHLFGMLSEKGTYDTYMDDDKACKILGILAGEKIG